jgi:hypothetical protein
MLPGRLFLTKVPKKRRFGKSLGAPREAYDFSSTLTVVLIHRQVQLQGYRDSLQSGLVIQ